MYGHTNTDCYTSRLHRGGSIMTFLHAYHITMSHYIVLRVGAAVGCWTYYWQYSQPVRFHGR